jgi:hypothetical protein
VETNSKVFEVDPMLCPQCRGAIKVVVFITDYRAIDWNIDHLKLLFATEKLPPAYVFKQVSLMAAEESGDYEERGNGERLGRV